MAGADRPGNGGRAFGAARCGPFSQHRAEFGPGPSVVVLAVDAASDAGRQDAAAPGQQPGSLGRVLRTADEGSTSCPQAADDDAHQATGSGPGPDGRLSPATGQGQLHAH